MTDLELLEKAAKAAGIDAEWHDGCGDALAVKPGAGLGFGRYWNPLADDGDALRLAVKLGLTINPYREGVFVSRYEGEQIIQEEFEVQGKPGTTSTRRAIVRAAAALAE